MGTYVKDDPDDASARLGMLMDECRLCADVREASEFGERRFLRMLLMGMSCGGDGNGRGGGIRCMM